MSPPSACAGFPSAGSSPAPAFLVRSYNLAAAKPAGFADTDGSGAAADIDALHAADITRGLQQLAPPVLSGTVPHNVSWGEPPLFFGCRGVFVVWRGPELTRCAPTGYRLLIRSAGPYYVIPVRWASRHKPNCNRSEAAIGPRNARGPFLWDLISAPFLNQSLQGCYGRDPLYVVC